MKLRIPDEKLCAVLKECVQWLLWPTKARKALQNLLGRLAHIANCIPAVWRFMSRLLTSLQGPRGPGPTEIDTKIHKDFRWFCTYA